MPRWLRARKGPENGFRGKVMEKGSVKDSFSRPSNPEKPRRREGLRKPILDGIEIISSGTFESWKPQRLVGQAHVLLRG